MSNKNIPMPSKTKEDRDWQVRDALSTLQRAEQIKNDKQLMPMVKKAAADLQKAVGRAVSRPGTPTRKGPSKGRSGKR